MEEHGEAVGGAAAGFGGGVEETGFSGAVDGVVNEEVRLEDAGREDGGVSGAEADGGGVDDEVDGVEFVSDGGFVPGHDFEAVLGTEKFGRVEEGFEFLAEEIGFFRGAVDDDEALAFFHGGLPGEGLAGTAGAEDEDAEVTDIDGEIFADGTDPAIAVGVESDKAAVVVAEDGVDCLHGAGGFGQFVHVLGEGDFVGEGAVPALEVKGAKGLHGGVELFGRDVEPDVGGGEVASLESGELHLGGEGVRDGMAHHAVAGGVGRELIELGKLQNGKHAGSYRVIRQKSNISPAWKSRLNRGKASGYGGLMPRALDGLKEQLLDSYAEIGGINHIDGANLPSKRAVARITEELLHLMFPGFFRETCLTQESLEESIGRELETVREDLIREVGKSLEFEVPADLAVSVAPNATEQKVDAFLRELPRIRALLGGDVEAAYEGDPAAKSFEEIILAYPGIEAVAVQRLAHELYRLGVALIPRMMTEWAHSRTGIDIHPGAKIGEHFFIDHGTGVVVGETCEIGNRVKIYHAVTLGARSTSGGQALREVKRHPTIEDDVTIYSGAVILGGETRIGKGSMIGGNVFLLESVPPNSVVYYDEHSVVVRPRGHYEPDFMI